MFIAPDIDPIAISIGPLDVRWYGLMYFIGFLGGGLLGVYRARMPGSGWKGEEVWDLLFYIAIGTVVGGRLGYGLFYNTSYYLSQPWELLYVWSGGMSFHGGAIGVVVAAWLFARRTRRSLLMVTDFASPLVPLGLGVGRIGNFINQELWGRVTDLPWGVVFRDAGDLPRHPSQLYEAFLEGLVLFVLVWWFAGRNKVAGRTTGILMFGYAVARILVEFLREPDAHIGTVGFGWMTMGQVLSLPLLLIGALLLFRSKS